MGKHQNLDPGQAMPAYWTDALQEFISTVAANLVIEKATATSIRIVASAGTGLVALGFGGPWRYNIATVTAAHPAGAAGDYLIFATATANNFTGTPPNVDITDYAFGLEIRASGTPSTALYRQIGTTKWDGASIISVTQTVGGAGGGASGSFYGAGWILDFGGPVANLPPTIVSPADGRYFAEAAQPALFARIGHTWDTFGGLASPGAGNFRVPDLRGRGTIGLANMGSGGTIPAVTGARVQRTGSNTLGTLLGEEYHTLIVAEIPSHSHGGVTATNSVNHTHTGTSGNESVDHTHVVVSHSHGGGNHSHSYQTPTGSMREGDDPADYIAQALNTTASTTSASGVIIAAEAPATGGRSVTHTHTTTTGIDSVTHTHTISAEGGGGAHDNLHPVAVVVKAITLQ